MSKHTWTKIELWHSWFESKGLSILTEVIKSLYNFTNIKQEQPNSWKEVVKEAVFFFELYSLCLNCLFPCQRNLFLLTVYLHAWSSLKQIFHLMQIGLWMGLDLCSCYLFMMPSPNYQKVKPAFSFVGSWLQYSLHSFLIKAKKLYR